MKEIEPKPISTKQDLAFIDELMQRIESTIEPLELTDEELLRLEKLSKISGENSQDAVLCYDIAEILGYTWENEKAEDILVSMLDVLDFVVRAEAADSLAAMAKKESTLEKLVRRIYLDNHEIAQEYMIWAISDIVLNNDFQIDKYIQILQKMKLDFKNSYLIRNSTTFSLCALGGTQYFVDFFNCYEEYKNNPDCITSILQIIRNLAKDDITLYDNMFQGNIEKLVTSIPDVSVKGDKKYYINELKQQILNTYKK